MDFHFLVSELYPKDQNDMRDSIIRLMDFVVERGESDNITVALVKAV